MLAVLQVFGQSQLCCQHHIFPASVWAVTEPLLCTCHKKQPSGAQVLPGPFRQHFNSVDHVNGDLSRLAQVAWNVVLCRIASAEKPALEKRRSGLSLKDHTEPRKQTLSQYLQSMRKPGRHKDDMQSLKAGGRSDSISRGKGITLPLPAV